MAYFEDLFAQHGLNDLANNPNFIQWLSNSPAGGQIQQAMSGNVPEDFDAAGWLSNWGNQFQRVKDEGGSAGVTGGPNHDSGYWNSQGIGNEQIFDENGQLRPGWTRTANGYEPVPGGTQPPPPGPNQGDGGNRGGTTPPASGGGSGGPSGGFQFPTFTPPSYTPPGPYTGTPPMAAPPPFAYPEFERPADFSYDAFSAPTLDQAKNEPGYEFAMDQGRKALENSAAARGTLRTGGTLKDLFSWGNQFAEQNYGNVFDRAKNIYGTNRENAFGNWAANTTNKFNSWQANRSNAADAYSQNYGIARDVWDRGNQQSLDIYGLNADAGRKTFDIQNQQALEQFNPQFQASQLQFSDLYNRWRDQLNSLTALSTA